MAHTGTLVGGLAPWAWCSGECCRCGVGGETSLANGARFGGEARHLAQSSAQSPALERQLNQAEAELRIAEEKQALLVGLLAGRDKVQTFLALLNQQAVASGVQMQRYEPLKTPPPTQGKSRRNNRRSKSKQKAEPPQDPLQALGYRKSSVALEVSGSFGGLQTFLQRMEALELLVESSDLSAQGQCSEDNDDQVKHHPSKQINAAHASIEFLRLGSQSL